MENFFTPARTSKWANGPYPHFLLLLNRYEAYRDYAAAHHDLFAQYPDQLGVVPLDWLHCTVQGLYAPMTEDQTRDLIAAARRELTGMKPFRVQIGPVWPGVTAVTVAMYPENGVAELNRRVRSAAQTVDGIELPPAERKFWAHSSLAYSMNDFGDRSLNRGLRELRPERVDLMVDRVHLVNQQQHPPAGYYTWTVVQEFPFT